ncbi:16S rRNA (cytidine(1402)-2'-O)-methyltransferase [Candidatus Paracaedibacter symbiosus]|uniref:16S rRNA (cytidine(1402)-2'-O)-methyltransferase n=1 Tax=Candidatus Paracaedibacter symbiosus TaxID=244582 RepID=UPI000509FCB2|nr:16S rRNA (cytidine(1402)-2'-O)-methyltransferase [Candidatus Paracaedibacter symbiosus]
MLDLPDFLPVVTPGLYIVATPIGNRGDITLRALSVLSKADIIACEDTRTSLKLLQTFAINKPLWAYHDHNGDKMRPKIIEALQDGKIIALISDAGMPLISDPGYKLVRACYKSHLPVTTVPGASAVLAGLVLSAMPSDRFMFCGFAHPKDFSELKSIPATLVFFEAPQRVIDCLRAMQTSFPDREIAVVREITKRFEQVVFGSYADVITHYTSLDSIKGEFVIVLSPPQKRGIEVAEIDAALTKLLPEYSVKEASHMIAETLGLPRKQVYQRALALKDD